ncbi:hypothetical protein EVAR_50701_1 [Eumeta japonica]|uniref:Uncharacterized protein n=1 Tax=Eumeta variegata TaxID=151549 RepID=A0A4C1YLY6_EUMVA|nr:hypothetical protein EVAR_50701_1 [Eumeta japonica]
MESEAYVHKKKSLTSPFERTPLNCYIFLTLHPLTTPPFVRTVPRTVLKERYESAPEEDEAAHEVPELDHDDAVKRLAPGYKPFTSLQWPAPAAPALVLSSWEGR